MAALSLQADLVLLDSPPVLPVTDATLLSTQADGRPNWPQNRGAGHRADPTGRSATRRHGPQRRTRPRVPMGSVGYSSNSQTRLSRSSDVRLEIGQQEVRHFLGAGTVGASQDAHVGATGQASAAPQMPGPKTHALQVADAVRVDE